MTAYDSLKDRFQKHEISCEICGSDNQVAFQKYGRNAEPGIYGEQPVTICSDCGFKMQNPRYEDAFYIAYYEEMYREVAFGATKPSEEYISQQKDRGRRVLDFIRRRGVSSKGKMLDHGCASGATMLGWQDDGWQVSGIDPHRPSVEIAKLMGLDVRVGAGEDLPCEDEEFDLLLSLGSFEHSYNLDMTMRECSRVLKMGGKLVIRWRSDKIFGSPLEYYNHNHYRFFSRNTWKIALARYGFKLDVMSDERVEGWDSYEYIIATKSLADIDAIVLGEVLAQYPGDDCKTELENMRKLRVDYYSRCRKFLDIHAEMSSDEELFEYLRFGDSGLKWGWLGGQPKDVVARAVKEAKLYIAEYEAGRVA